MGKPKPSKPIEFKNHIDSTIYEATVLGVYTLEKGKPTTKGLGEPDNVDIWFLVRIYNEGKIQGQWISVSHHHYLVDYAVEEYYFAITNYHWAYHGFTNKKDFENINNVELAKYPHVRYPTLGPKNAIKIKKAIREFIKSI